VSLSFQIFQQNSVNIRILFHTCYMPHLSKSFLILSLYQPQSQ
jgi:hypothetical protein